MGFNYMLVTKSDNKRTGLRNLSKPPLSHFTASTERSKNKKATQTRAAYQSCTEGGTRTHTDYSTRP